MCSLNPAQGIHVTNQFTGLKKSWLHCGQISIGDFLFIAVALALGFSRWFWLGWGGCLGLKRLRMT